MEYEYKQFVIDITKRSKWSYKLDKMDFVYEWKIKHLGHTLKSGSTEHENEPSCKSEAEKTVDSLYRGY